MKYPVSSDTCIVLAMSSPSPDEAAAIEQKLVAWGRARDELDASRDRLVLEAYAQEPNVHRIHKLTGIGRATIYRIIEHSQMKNPKKQ